MKTSHELEHTTMGFTLQISRLFAEMIEGLGARSLNQTKPDVTVKQTWV